MHIPGAGCFYQGFLVTDSPVIQALIQRHDLFGVHIFPLALDLTCMPIREDKF
jgi:hypothetical protein